MSDSDFLTIREAAFIADLSTQRIHQMANAEKLRSEYISPMCRMVAREDLEQHMLEYPKAGTHAVYWVSETQPVEVRVRGLEADGTVRILYQDAEVCVPRKEIQGVVCHHME